MMVRVEQQSPLALELERQGRRFDWFTQQMGQSRWSVWRAITGRAVPRAGFYERAAVVLGVPVEQIKPNEQEAAA
jgi:hypothetical protein